MTDISAGLSNLLELSSQLHGSVHGITIHPDIEPIRLHLSEILTSSKALASGSANDTSRGTFLLAQASNNPEHTEYAMNLIQLNDLALPLQTPENHLDSFVRHAKEQDIMAIIETRRREIEEDFRAFIQSKLALDWPSRKTALIDNFKKQKKAAPEELDTKSDSGDRNPSAMHWLPSHVKHDTIVFTDVRHEAENTWSAKEQTFVQAISSLNEHRQMKQSVAIGSLMSQLTRSLGSDLATHQLADAWQMLSFIANEKHVEHGKTPVGRLLHARQYAKEYAAQRDSTATNRMISDGSRRYLEDQFFSLIEREIARNPQQARLGGLPTIEGKMKAFVNLRLQKNGSWIMSNLELVNNVPVWAVLFYFMRAGFVNEAAQYSARNEMLFSKLEKNWCLYIAAYAEDASHNLPRPLADRLHTEYNQRIKFGNEGTDPFKQALFKIIGRCDLSHKTLSGILQVTEDWMWLQLSLIREVPDSEPKYEHYRLSTLQDSLLHYGERHFNNKGANPMLYFQMLLLSGQFERAIQNLASKSWTDAVHFAIVLTYYGLLRISTVTPDRQERTLLLQDDNSARLNFAELIESYSLQIRNKSSTAAVEYATLICLNADLADGGRQQIDACHRILRSLILDTRDFATLLGDIRADGTREPGFIEKRLNLLELHDEKQYLRTISEQAAAVSEREGRLADAILLYHLSEEYDVVVSLVNNFLGAFLLEHSISNQHDSGSKSFATAEDAPALARNMFTLYNSNAAILATVSQSNLTSCKMLLAMVESMQLFHSGNYSGSLVAIDQLNIFPTGDNVSVGMIKDMANNFNLLDDSVARNVPNLLLLTVRCLKAKHDALLTGEYNDQSRKSQMQAIKTRARHLNTFAGLIKYQMSEEVRVGFENVASSIR